MFAISFDMSVSSPIKFFGQPYNRAYFEIKKVLNGFREVHTFHARRICLP